MDAGEIAALLAKDREAWDALTSALEARPDEVLHDPESPLWTARDVYSHLARWIDRSMDQLEVVLADGERLAPMPGRDDEINARWQAETRSRVPPRARYPGPCGACSKACSRRRARPVSMPPSG